MKRHLLILLVACCFSLAVSAVEQPDFYSAAVPVADREPASYRQGLRDALVQVLAKASAEAPHSIRQSPGLAVDLSKGEKLASQFSYVTRKEPTPTGELQDRLYLKASFPEKTVNELLQKGNLRLWPNNRPQVLIWLVVKTAKGAKVASISNGQDANLIKMMGDKAQDYGLPWVMGEPASQANAEKLWQWDEAEIARVSQVYKKQVILVARMASTSDNGAMGGWLLVDAGRNERVDINVGSAAGFVDRGIGWAASRLANRYAMKLSSTNNELVLVVDGINSETKYFRLMDYLGKLDVLESVYLLSADGDVLRLAVKLKSDVSHLQNVLALEKKLLLKPGEEPGADQLYFIWNEP